MLIKEDTEEAPRHNAWGNRGCVSHRCSREKRAHTLQGKKGGGSGEEEAAVAGLGERQREI